MVCQSIALDCSLQVIRRDFRRLARRKLSVSRRRLSVGLSCDDPLSACEAGRDESK
jgi:hypothetical protein